MKITDHINKISWSVADKLTFALYGIATIAILQVTNRTELGLFTLFNNLHNFILSISSYLGLQALLHFSADKNNKSQINSYAMLNQCIVVTIMIALILLLRYPLAAALNEPDIVTVAQSLPLLILFSIPRYFAIYIMYRELLMFRVFIANLVYFGIMSGLIFYCVITNRFLTYTDIINITYIGSAASTIVAFILTFTYWKFSLTGVVKYIDVVKFSLKYAVTGITLTLPRTLDVFAIQLFFGTNIVGLYAPAKTIFRFIEDAINTIYAMIYAPSVKCFANNDMVSLNKLISKSISLLMISFTGLTIACWLCAPTVFSYFLPERFISATPFFNVLMLSSIVLPFTLLSTTISASGKPEIVAKYILYSLATWIVSFYIIGNFLQNYEILVAVPNFIFNLILAVFLFRYASKHYNLRFRQLFRSIPDFYYFILQKIKK